MKKILLTVLILMFTACFAYASDWSVTSPMETGVTAFYNPGTGAVYGGVNHTILRVQHAKVTFATLDVDGTLAQEINEDADTLAGIGVKINSNLLKTKAEPGFNLMPSIGVTAMTNFDKSEFPRGIISKAEVLIYGTVIMYSWK